MEEVIIQQYKDNDTRIREMVGNNKCLKKYMNYCGFGYKIPASLDLESKLKTLKRGKVYCENRQ